jgi:ACS family pantothenate transporter-like MFS transporter
VSHLYFLHAGLDDNTAHKSWLANEVFAMQVAGLREALNMSGHDYNTVLSVTIAGYG